MFSINQIAWIHFRLDLGIEAGLKELTKLDNQGQEQPIRWTSFGKTLIPLCPRKWTVWLEL